MGKGDKRFPVKFPWWTQCVQACTAVSKDPRIGRRRVESMVVEGFSFGLMMEDRINQRVNET